MYHKKDNDFQKRESSAVANDSVSNETNDNVESLAPPALQLKTEENEQGTAQFKKNHQVANGGEVPPPFNGDASPIQRKEDDVLSGMGESFGADFSNVKMHTNSNAAKDMGALAYTQGNDVHFAPGQYNPSSQSGKELIGHELTHVVQQRQGRVNPTTEINGKPVNDNKGLEQEADDMGAKVAQKKSVNSSSQTEANNMVAGNNVNQLASVPESNQPIQRTGNPQVQEPTDVNIMGRQVRRTLSNINARSITPDTFSHLIQTILGGNGSSAAVGIEVGLAAVREIGIWGLSAGEVSAGVKINLGGQAEIKNDGKFSLTGSAGITGFVHGEITGLISGDGEAGATFSLEGEWDSVLHFGAYVYQRIHSAARTAVSEIEAQGFGDYVPGSLRLLANAPDSSLGQRSPEITSKVGVRASAGGAIGGDDAGISIGGSAERSVERFTKSTDGVTTETGTEDSTTFTGGITVGRYGLQVSIKNSIIDSSIDANDKHEEEWNVELSNVTQSLDTDDYRQIGELGMGMNALTNLSSAAMALGRNMASRVTQIASGPPTTTLSGGSDAKLGLKLKFELNNGARELKEIAVTTTVGVNESVALQVPGAGALDIRGSAGFTGSVTRTVFFMSF